MNHPDTTLLSVTTVGVKTFHMISRVKGVVRTKPPFGSASVLYFRKQRKFLEQASNHHNLDIAPSSHLLCCCVPGEHGKRPTPMMKKPQNLTGGRFHLRPSDLTM